jgi:hypothetical protein
MTELRETNLIHILTFYLMLVAVLGTFQRMGHYWRSVGLVLKSPGRWPNLCKVVKQHRTVFMTWATILPVILAVVLTGVQLFASYWVWPTARLKAGEVIDRWIALVPAVLTGIGMVAVDTYFIIRVPRVDHAKLEKNFDLAEYWLRSSTAHVLRIVTFGFLNPRQMVDKEVRTSLMLTSKDLNYTMWWVSLQAGLRVAFGLTLWLTWAAIKG